MNKLIKVVKYSSLGVFLAGIVSVVQGCSIKEGSLIAALLFLLSFCTAPMDDGGQTSDPSSPPAPPVTEIVLYSAGEFNEDLATAGGGATGREGADNLCSRNKPVGITNPNTAAFISTTGTDHLYEMPLVYPIDPALQVTGPNGFQLAADWAALTTEPPTNLDTTFTAAEVTTNPLIRLGSVTTAVVEASALPPIKKCSGYETTAGLDKGTDGLIDRSRVTDKFNLYEGTAVAGVIPVHCTDEAALLCVAF